MSIENSATNYVMPQKQLKIESSDDPLTIKDIGLWEEVKHKLDDRHPGRNIDVETTSGPKIIKRILEGWYEAGKFINDNPVELTEEEIDSCFHDFFDEEFNGHLQRLEESRGFKTGKISDKQKDYIKKFKPMVLE